MSRLPARDGAKVKPRDSLPVRISAVSLSSLVAMGLTLGLSGVSVVRMNEFRFATSRAELAASEIAAGLERNLALGSDIELAAGFDQAFAAIREADKVVGGAGLFDPRGGRLRSAGDVDAEWPGDAFLGRRLVGPRAPPSGELTALRAVIGPGGTLAGYVLVKVDRGVLDRIVGNVLGLMLSMSVVVIASIAAVQGVIFRRVAGIPLRRLVATAGSLEAGDVGMVSDLERRAGPDDVGRIYAAFARLVKRLLEAQAELVERNRELDATVRRRTEELVVAKEGAEAANRAKSAFLASMSHEIRTPMNSVLGYLDLLALGRLGEEERGYLSVVKANAGYLLALIDDILDFSKIESGRLDLDDEPFDPLEVLEGAVRMLEPKAAEKGIDLSLRGSGAPRCRGDRLRLGQVVVNLLANAVKFTPEGGKVAAELEASRERGGIRLSFSVADTGIGIASDRLDRIFEAFGQADASIAGRYGGTGLGLTISSRIVRLMGGRLRVESELGRGSRFSFSVVLPEAEGGRRAASPEAGSLASFSAQAETPPVGARPAEGSRPTAPLRPGAAALVAEDTRDSRFLIVRMLEKLGLSVDAASDGGEALSRFLEGRYDVVILDGQMPVMDGSEVARRIREEEAARGAKRTPIVALSAKVLAEERDEFLRSGADDFVSKPVSMKALAEVLARLVGPGPGAEGYSPDPAPGGEEPRT